MVNIKLHCPQCRQLDRVEKVSAVYAGGKSTGSYSGYSSGTHVSTNSGTVYVPGSNVSMSGSSQTSLSTKLAPPSKPSGGGSIGGVLGALACGWMMIQCALGTVGFTLVGLLSILNPSLYVDVANKPRPTGLIFLASVGAAIFTLVFLRAMKSSWRQHTKAKDYQQSIEIPKWNKNLHIWQSLYYCGRCDGIYQLSDTSITDSSKVIEYINK